MITGLTILCTSMKIPSTPTATDVLAMQGISSRRPPLATPPPSNYRWNYHVSPNKSYQYSINMGIKNIKQTFFPAGCCSECVISATWEKIRQFWVFQKIGRERYYKRNIYLQQDNWLLSSTPDYVDQQSNHLYKKRR